MARPRRVNYNCLAPVAARPTRHDMNADNSPPSKEDLDPYYGGKLGAGIDWSDPNSPLAPYYFTTGGVMAVALLGVAFFVLSSRPLWHTDFWVHLKFGEWIASNRTLPEREPFSPYTDKQSPLFDSMWLSQVGYHGLFRGGSSLSGGGDRQRFEGGVEAIRIVHCLAAIVALGLFGLAYRRTADSVPWAIGGMAAVFLLMSGALTTQRPQLFGLACFAWLLCLIGRSTVSRRVLLLVPLVMVLWANLHGSFVVGFVLQGAILAGRALEVARARHWSLRALRDDDAVRRLTIVLATSITGVAVLNPYGPYLYLHVVRFGGHPNLGTLAEWQPLDFTAAAGGHWSYLALAAVVVLTPLVTRQDYSLPQILVILAFSVGPLFQQRMMVWWIPLVPWIVAPNWVAAASRWSVIVPENVPSFRKTALAALLALVAIIASPASTWLKSGKPRPGVPALHKGTPRDIAAALQGEEPADPDRVRRLTETVRSLPGGRYRGPVFCSESQGEFLLWTLPTDTPVMMFNHAHLFQPAYWAGCLAVKQGLPPWRELLDRAGAGVVVVEADYHPRLCEELRSDPAWQVVVDEAGTPGHDADSRLFVAIRKAGKPQERK